MNTTTEVTVMQLRFHSYEIPQDNGTPGSIFWHKGVRHVFVSQQKNFVGSRCLIEAINTETGHRSLIFADEIR